MTRTGKNPADHGRIIHVLLNRANVLCLVGRPERSLDGIKRGLAISGKSGDKQSLADCYLQLSEVYGAICRYEDLLNSAQESLKLESGLILLAIAVSGAPFLGLLGTVWGVMSTFGHIAQQGSATMTAMAPGVAAALITTVAGLLVAIPSMFGYNWLVHNLRVLTVELDNFAQELVSKMETEYLEDD